MFLVMRLFNDVFSPSLSESELCDASDPRFESYLSLQHQPGSPSYGERIPNRVSCGSFKYRVWHIYFFANTCLLKLHLAMMR